jgi:hypothetical protein
MIVLSGALCLAFGVLLLFIARPVNGELTPFLRYPYAEPGYALLVTILIGGGIAGVLAGIGALVFG